MAPRLFDRLHARKWDLIQSPQIARCARWSGLRSAKSHLRWCLAGFGLDAVQRQQVAREQLDQDRLLLTARLQVHLRQQRTGLLREEDDAARHIILAGESNPHRQATRPRISTWGKEDTYSNGVRYVDGQVSSKTLKQWGSLQRTGMETPCHLQVVPNSSCGRCHAAVISQPAVDLTVIPMTTPHMDTAISRVDVEVLKRRPNVKV